MISKQKQIGIWLVWLFTIPLGLWFSFQIAPPQSVFQNADLLVFAVLIVAVALIPIVINNTPVMITQWVSLVVFLEFGLFIELLLGQLVVSVVILRLNLRKEHFFNYALNSTMMMLISICSALVYYGLGGNHEVFSFSNVHAILLVGAYLIAFFIFNHLFMSLFQYLLIGQVRKIKSREVVWESLAQLFVFPLGLTIYFLYNSSGILSIILVGLPMIFGLLLLRFLSDSQQKNVYLQKAAEFGHLLTKSLKTDEVIEVFMNNVLKMFPADYFYILDNIDGERLEFLRGYEKGKMVTIQMEPIRKYEGISGLVWATEKSVIYGERRDWTNIVTGYIPKDAESVLAVPMKRNNEVTGVVFLASSNKRQYMKYQLMILDILCSYFAISIENARHYERTKYHSERCSLTGLYNVRYFTEVLEATFDRFLTNQIQHISVLIIDVDHFKSVNDTFGHQSGNELLIQLADLLRNLVSDYGVLARYGGEEFVIMLPNVTKTEAVHFGEFIRETINKQTFEMNDDLSDKRERIAINITVSIGVASAPEDTDESMSLMRYADRALYLGAKRVGRNRVAEYVK